MDVGRGQLAEALRHDPRVVSMERTNARALGPGVLPTTVFQPAPQIQVGAAARIIDRLALGAVLGASGAVEPATNGGPGTEAVARARSVHQDFLGR